MAVRVLGPVEVDVAGEPAWLGGAQPKAVLALLALHRGRRVTVEAIADELWGDDHPTTARRTIQTYISKLRQLLVPGAGPRDPRQRIRTEGDAYLLDCAPEEVDADLAAAALAEAAAASSPRAALTTAERGLALFRGEPFAGVPVGLELAVGVTRLENLRRDLLNLRLQALLDTNRGTEALPAARELAAGDPFDERAHALLMRALDAAGQTGEALATYRAFRRRLVDVHGIEPGPLLERTHLELLSRPSAGPQPLPPLPAPLSAFIGRTAQLQRIEELFGHGVRLVTLVGAGGIGKSRLALEVGRRHPGPAALVELAAVEAEVRVARAIADAVGAQGDDPAAAAVEELRAHADILLIVDNCEHLVDEVAALVQRLLADCPELRVLATSRRPLSVPSEAVLRVPPLPADEAAALFADRLPAGVATGGEETVEAICATLDGVPLAIEITAASAGTLALQDLARTLHDRMLTLRVRAQRAHHRTMTTTLEWSEALLSTPASALLRRLSAFRGTFTLDAADQVASFAPVRHAELTETLSELVGNSLVEPVGADRYRLLVPVRQFAAVRLEEALEEKEVHHRHAEWVSRLVEPIEVELRGPDNARCRELIDAEHPNIAVALDRALEAAWPEIACRIVGRAWWYWFRSGHQRSGAAWAERALALSDDQPDLVRADVQVAAGHFRWFMGDLAGAAELLQAAVDLYRTHDEPRGISQALPTLGWIVVSEDPVRGAALLEEALTANRLAQDEWGAVATLNMLADAWRRQGRRQEAHDAYRQGYAFFADHDDRYGMAWSLWGQANTAPREALDTAVEQAGMAGRLFAAIGHRAGVALTVALLAVLADRQGRDRLAARLLAALDGVTDAERPQIDFLVGEVWGLRERLTPTDEHLSYEAAIDLALSG